MKNYNVNSLYVVGEKNSNHYFICKYNLINKTYEEIFTGEKIKIYDNNTIKLLSDYYTNSQQFNNKTKSPLILTKKELLRKYIEINNEANLEKNEDCSLNDDNFKSALEKATEDFFPETGKWYSVCFDKSPKLNISYLPCHLRDNLWLAKMLRKHQNLSYISERKVLEFVKTSAFFKEKRDGYEQKIVKWQIEWMINGGENWIVDSEYGGEFVFITNVCDLGFRKGIVDTLSNIGMNIDAVEKGIEKNADMWRNRFMTLAFLNEYEPIIYDFHIGINHEDVAQLEERKKETLEHVDPEFKDNWLKMRKYEYYQRHKDSVDKYGIVEPDMQLTPSEVENLKIYLKQKDNERKLQIKQFRQKREKSRLRELKKY